MSSISPINDASNIEKNCSYSHKLDSSKLKPSPEEINRRKALITKMEATYLRKEIEAERKYAELSPKDQENANIEAEILIKRMSSIPLTEAEQKWRMKAAEDKG